MRIASIGLVLALLSPASALRGTRRELEDLSDIATTAPSDVVIDDSEQSDIIPYEDAAPLLVAPPTAAPTFSESMIASFTDAGVWDAESNEYTGTDAAHKKGSSKSSSSKSSKGTGTPPAECASFCQRFLETCEAANPFFDPMTPRGAPGRRLIEGDEPSIVRLGDGVYSATEDCISACAGYPRPDNPDNYLSTNGEVRTAANVDANSFGDTFWCRQTHLDLAARQGTDYAAQVHCPAASPSGGGVCTNAGLGLDLIDTVSPSALTNVRATAWELIRVGADTGRHLGYCSLYYNDVVADCTNAGIETRTLGVAMSLLPPTVEVIILNNNVGKVASNGARVGMGITKLENGVFDNLICRECVRSLIIDQGNLAEVEANAFASLKFVEQISMNMQPLVALPAGLLNGNVNLREFTVYNSPKHPGQLTSLPDLLLFNNAFIQRFVISGHPNLLNLQLGTFRNINSDISFMLYLDLSNNGLTNNGLPSGMFNNLGELQFLDLSRNDIRTGNAGWFGPSIWTYSLRRFYIYDNPITTFTPNFYENMISLEVSLAHDLDMIAPAPGAFNNNPNLISYTLSERLG